MPDNNSQEFIRRRLFQNSAVMLMCQFVTTGAALISVPVIIAKLGMGGYGIWESILAVSMLFAIFQASIRGTLLWKISGAYGAKDPSQAKRMVRLGVAATMAITVLVIPVVWVARHQLVQLINIPAESVEAAAWILPCVVGLITLSGINEALGAAVSGYQQAGLTTMIQAASLVARYAVVIFGLLMGWQLWSLLAGFATAQLIGGVGLYVAATKICGRLSLIPAIPTRGEIKSMYSYAGFMIVGSISAALRNHTDKVVLASFASPTWAGYYAIAARLAALVRLACNFFYVPTTAAIGALHAGKDWGGVRRLYSNVITVMSVFCGGVVVLVAGLYDRILIMWLGKTVPEVAPILFLLLFGVTVGVMLAGTGSSVCKGIGRLGEETVRLVLDLTLNVIFKVVLVLSIGAIGAVVSSAASWAIASVVFVVLLHRMVDLPVVATRRAVWVLGVVVALVVLARLLLQHVPPAPDRLHAFASAAIFGTVLFAVYSAIVLALRIVSFQSLQRTWLQVRSRVAKLTG